MLGYLLTTIFNKLGQGPGIFLLSVDVAFNHANEKTVKYEKLGEPTIDCQICVFVCRVWLKDH